MSYPAASAYLAVVYIILVMSRHYYKGEKLELTLWFFVKNLCIGTILANLSPWLIFIPYAYYVNLNGIKQITDAWLGMHCMNYLLPSEIGEMILSSLKAGRHEAKEQVDVVLRGLYKLERYYNSLYLTEIAEEQRIWDQLDIVRKKRANTPWHLTEDLNKQEE